MSKADITIIIATTLEPLRVDALALAVDSILSQKDCVAVPLIVANGERVSSSALQYWKNRRDVRFLQLEEGNQLKARRLGRGYVDTEFFGSLDDDDVFLPGSLSARLAPMRADPTVDAVVGNGLIVRGGVERVMLSKLSLHRVSPLVGLAIENWMPSACAAVFRTATVGPQYFEHADQGLEWTALGYRLVVDGRKIAFVDDLTYRITDTPRSLSKSLGYAIQAPDTIKRLLELPVPKRVRSIWGQKYGSALHWLADIRLAQGEIGPAWAAHLKSLQQPGGIKYALYTRKLLRKKLSSP